MTAKPRLILRLGFLTICLATLASVAGFLVFRHLWRHGLPCRAGRLPLVGLSSPVTIRFDSHAVPHIEAKDERDLAMALGWTHANDRMGQMELARRAAAGRLAELFGKELLETDVRMRRLRLPETTAALWRAAGPESRLWLRAYAAGVNAWLDSHRGDLPPLYSIGGLTVPEPWRPQDSLALPLLMAAQLSFAFGPFEEQRLATWMASGRRGLRYLWGKGIDVPAGLGSFRSNPRGIPAPALAPRAEGTGGSNDWAVDGRRSATSLPLLANDPHLALGLPALWYEVHLRAPGLEVAGMSLPGIPGVVIGHNRELAWGLTNFMLDDRDLLLEEISADGLAVRRVNGWLPIQREERTIHVRWGTDRRLELLRSDLGPILPADPKHGIPARSLLWTAHQARDVVSVFLGLARAASVEDALAVVREGNFVCPAQNLLLADRRGHIARTLLGRVPDRKSGDGRLPRPAAPADAGWRGLRPGDSAFAVVDPPEHFLATANDDEAPPGWHASADFDLPFRAQRIRARLATSESWRVSSFAALQMDVQDDYAAALLARCDPGPVQGDARSAWDALSAWDHRAATQGPAALFLLFEDRLDRELFAAEERRAGIERADPFFRRQRLLRALDHLSDSTPIVTALAAAWGALVAHDGTDPGRWNYGDRHALTLRHPLGEIPLLGRLFDRGPYPMPGSPTTIAAFGGVFEDGRLEIRYGPSMRFIADLSAWDRSRAVLPGGQCGHPADPHYDDQIDDYLHGRSHPMPWSPEAVAAAESSRLVLHP